MSGHCMGVAEWIFPETGISNTRTTVHVCMVPLWTVFLPENEAVAATLTISGMRATFVWLWLDAILRRCDYRPALAAPLHNDCQLVALLIAAGLSTSFQGHTDFESMVSGFRLATDRQLWLRAVRADLRPTTTLFKEDHQ